MYIPYGRQWINEEDIQEVAEILRSDFLTTGPKVAEFEAAVAEYTGARYAVAVSNGTAALHLACMAAGIGEGDEVITTPMTFAASANCVLYTGGTPVFADIDPLTYNISPESVRSKITDRTKALIPVHYAGQPCDMDALHSIAKEHQLVVIEDAAHALGAEYKGKRIGALSDMTCFSFHPVKHITTCEGGMITTDSEELYKKLLKSRTHGIVKDPDQLLDPAQGLWYYEQQALGYNYRISDVQCALGLSQIKRLPFFVERRRALAKRYTEAFAGLENVRTPYQKEEVLSSYHLYVIQTPKERRREIYDKLKEAGIGVNVHYVPVYYHPYYREHGYRDICCENAEHLYDRLITLPLYPKMTDEEQDYVIKTVTQLLN